MRQPMANSAKENLMEFSSEPLAVREFRDGPIARRQLLGNWRIPGDSAVSWGRGFCYG